MFRNCCNLERRPSSREEIHAHVLFVAGPKRRVIQSTSVGPIEVIEKNGIHDLLDGDSPNILRSEKGE